MPHRNHNDFHAGNDKPQTARKRSREGWTIAISAGMKLFCTCALALFIVVFCWQECCLVDKAIAAAGKMHDDTDEARTRTHLYACIHNICLTRRKAYGPAEDQYRQLSQTATIRRVGLRQPSTMRLQQNKGRSLQRPSPLLTFQRALRALNCRRCRLGCLACSTRVTCIIFLCMHRNTVSRKRNC